MIFSTNFCYCYCCRYFGLEAGCFFFCDCFRLTSILSRDGDACAKVFDLIKAGPLLFGAIRLLLGCYLTSIFLILLLVETATVIVEGFTTRIMVSVLLYYPGTGVAIEVLLLLVVPTTNFIAGCCNLSVAGAVYYDDYGLLPTVVLGRTW